MNCIKCHSDNPEGITYCGQCGEKIEKICSKCNSVNPPQFKFCGQCGNDLTLASEPLRKELSSDEKLEKIQKYFPQGIMEKILSQGANVEGERRHVTVLFADISGFTAMSEMMDPEEVTGIMNKCFSMIGECIEKHGGTIDKFIGDCVMALFGAPIALEDAPQRAIRSAIMIHREMTQFNDRMKHEKENFKPLRMRIGIHTGPVVAGMVGSDGKQDFTVMGDTVNLASRMESLAEPGTTFVTEDTFKLTEGLFRFEALGEKQVKGKKEAVEAYRVIAPSTRRARFDVSAERGLTAFVGREKELELLLDGFERSKEGRGQAISILAEAGIGKSRLLYEFRKAVTNENITFLEGRCLSYSRNAAYHPVVDILKANFEIQDTDTDQEIREKVINGLKIIKVDEASALPYLLELLSVKESGFNKISLSPEAKKDRINETLKSVVLKGSGIRPLIMATEDLHWMDRSSEDAMKELLESIAGARVFLIFTYRPEFVHTWGSRSYHSQISLNRLSNRECIAMIEHVLGLRNIDPNLEDLILQKTEGIPFFIEEFIKSLKDLKIIESRDKTYRLSKDIHKITIPSTIQDVIMSRVDTLPEGSKEVLRTGSVIEREFGYDLIKRVTELPEQELLSHLSMLKDSELLYERGIYPQSAYIFRHALTREVVYDSILAKRRRQIHEKIAGIMEDIYRDDICYHYSVLAGHCIAGENYEKGAEYARLEAKRYQMSGLFKDAIEYAKKNVNSCEKLPQTEANQKKVIDARVTLASYYLYLDFHFLAREAVEPILDLALEINYRKRLPVIYSAIGNSYLWNEEDSRKGLEFIYKAIKVAEEVEDYISLAGALMLSSAFQSFISEFKDAHKRLKQSLDFSLLANNQRGIAFSKAIISMCYTIEGKMSPSYEFAQEALKLAKETDDIAVKSVTYPFYISSCYFKGLFDEAKTHFLEWASSYEKSASISSHGWAYMTMTAMLIDLGEYDEAVNLYKKQIQIMENNTYLPSIIKGAQSCLIRAKVLRHDQDIELSDVFACYENYKVTWWKGQTARNIGDILLHIDDDHLADADLWFRKAIEEDTKNAMRWQVAQDHAMYADWFKKKGDMRGAKEQLTKAIDIFRECGADGWVTRTEKDLAAFARV